MSEVVWVSNVMARFECTRDMTSDICHVDSKRAIDIGDHNEAGESLAAENFPKRAWPGEDYEGTITKLPNIWGGGCCWYVSPKVAEVLRQFDLGDGALYPMTIYQKDRGTQFAESWCCLNFGNVKQAFLLVQSSDRIRPGPDEKIGEGQYLPMYHRLPFVPQDEDVAISNAALEGPDIWADRCLADTFFISNRLREALKKAGVDKDFRLFKCRMIEGSKVLGAAA